MKILYSQPFAERIDSKFIMSCNTIPQTRDWTHGMMRRMLLTPLHARFDERNEGFDRDIGNKFEEERSGILNLAIEGYNRLNKNNGFTKCSVSEIAMNNYRQNNDSVVQWAEARTDIKVGHEEEQETAYASYVEFCKKMNFKALALPRFSNRLCETDERITSERSMRNGVRRTRFKGIKIQEVGYGF